MSTITMSKDFMKHLNIVDGLKEKAMTAYNNGADKSEIMEYIRQMRVQHGHVEIEFNSLVNNANKDDDDMAVLISTVSSILHVIHSNIRSAEKYTYKSSSSLPTIASSDGDEHNITHPNTRSLKYRNQGYGSLGSLGHSTSKNIMSNNDIPVTIHSKPNGEEISIDMDSESLLFPATAAAIASATRNTSKGSRRRNIEVLTDVEDMNPTELVEDINSTEADRLLNDFQKRFDLDVTNPTVVLYWGDWCGASKHFYPEWEKFKKLAKTKYHDLQVAELNFQRNNKEHENLVRDVGVDRFPTIIFFREGEMKKLIGGSKRLADIEELIKS